MKPSNLSVVFLCGALLMGCSGQSIEESVESVESVEPIEELTPFEQQAIDEYEQWLKEGKEELWNIWFFEDGYGKYETGDRWNRRYENLTGHTFQEDYDEAIAWAISKGYMPNYSHSTTSGEFSNSSSSTKEEFNYDIALRNVKQVIKAQLKDPDSFKCSTSDWKLYENSSKYVLEGTFTATNSFGGRVSHTFSATFIKGADENEVVLLIIE